MVIPVIMPPQLSVAVGISETVTTHSPSTFGKTGTIGACVSFTIIFCVAVALFPFPSSKSQVIV